MRLSGFTLVELLIVISVMGVLAGGVMVAINPADKINAANDVRVQSDISSVASALQTFFVNNNGLYPDGISLPPGSGGSASSGGNGGNATSVLGGSYGLVASKDLGSFPIPPSGYGTSYTYYWSNSIASPRAKIIGTQKKGTTVVVAWCSWTNTLTYGTTSYATNLNTCP